MQTYMKNLIGMAAVAALGLVALTTTAQSARAQAAAAAQPGDKKQKQVKDNQEYDLYNEVIKDAQPGATPGKKFLTDLDAWSQKYPETDFKDIRQMYYVQGYAANNDAVKAIETAKPLLDKGIEGLRTALDTDNNVLPFLFLSARLGAALAATGNPTPDQLATGEKAAHMLSDFGKIYFAADKKPAALAADQWAEGLKQVEEQAKGTIFTITLYPGLSASKKGKDPAACAATEAAYRQAQEKYAESGTITVELAKAMLCQQSANPAKVPQALYMYARAAGLPTTGQGALAPADQKQIEDYLKRIYTTYHGSDEGLAELKAMALKGTQPPADLKIKTASQVAMEAEEEFKTKNPQLAMWMSVKRQLADTEGMQYFETSLKGAAMAGENGAKLLKGKLVDAKPACRSKELLVAIPLPNNPNGTVVAEITIKLAAPLTGKPDLGGDILFNGAPTAFVKEPFMLTMDAEKTDIDGLNLTPCTAAAPAKKGVAPAPKKK